MGFFFKFLFLASTLSFSVNGSSASSIEGRLIQAKMNSVYRPLQVTRAQIERKAAAKLSLQQMETEDFRPTPVQKSEEQVATQESERLERRTLSLLLPLLSVRRRRVHAFLTECYNEINPHVENIRNLCKQRDQNTNPEKLGWDLVAELRAILSILQTCLTNISSVGYAPAPSNVPIAKFVSLRDICTVIFQIMCYIRECFQLIYSLCNRYKIVREVCSDTLKQISECLCTMMIQTSIQVGKISIDLGSLFTSIPNFFLGIDFGFRGIPSILRGHSTFLGFSAIL